MKSLIVLASLLVGSSAFAYPIAFCSNASKSVFVSLTRSDGVAAAEVSTRNHHGGMVTVFDGVVKTARGSNQSVTRYQSEDQYIRIQLQRFMPGEQGKARLIIGRSVPQDLFCVKPAISPSPRSF